MDKIATVIGSVLLSVIAAGVLALTIVGHVALPANPMVGSATGPDIPSPYLRWGNVAMYNAGQQMKTATTTLCAIKNPSAATSTILGIAFQDTVGTSTSALVDVATSTNGFSTTTTSNLLVGQSIASNAQSTFSFDPTSNANIIGPNQFLIFKTQGAGVGGYTYTGTCEAQFMSLQ